MFLRVIACALIVAGCTYLGMVFAARSKKRVAQLGEFKRALNQLEFDIDFLNITLAESFEKLANNSEETLRKVFSQIASSVRKNRCQNLAIVWKYAIQKYKDEIFLTDDEINIIIDFSKNLGSGDREKEKNNIKLAIMRLSVAEGEAREETNKNAKMYRGLGVLSGVFIVILLI